MRCKFGFGAMAALVLFAGYALAEDKPAATEQGAVYYGTVKSFDADKNTLEIELPPAPDASGKPSEKACVVTIQVPATSAIEGVDSKPLPTPKGGGSFKPGQQVGIQCVPQKQQGGKQETGKQYSQRVTIYPTTQKPTPIQNAPKLYSTIGRIVLETRQDSAGRLHTSMFLLEWNSEKQDFLPKGALEAADSLQVTAWYRDPMPIHEWKMSDERTKPVVVEYYFNSSGVRVANAMSISPGLLPSRP